MLIKQNRNEKMQLKKIEALLLPQKVITDTKKTYNFIVK